jgi:hypothetical protein
VYIPNTALGTIVSAILICLFATSCSVEGEVKDDPGIDIIHTQNGDIAGASGSTGGMDGAGQDGLGGPGAAGTNQPQMELSDACASVVNEAQQVQVEVETEVEVEVVVGKPVALYIMLDQSRSMGQVPQQETLTKWQVAVDALNDFVNDPASEDLDIALQYFPLVNGQCGGAGYDTPEVPMGRLLAHAPNITDSLAGHFPGIASGGFVGGSTPIEGALNGVTSFCARFKQDTTMNPEGKDCVAVLVTDGLPSVCSRDWAVLTGIAANAQANAEVMTFTIGMNGADFVLLDQIAQAGNGDCTPDPADLTWSCNVSTGDITFIDALNLIRETVTELRTITEVRTETQIQTLQCEWEIPDPPPDEQFDRDTVNVEFLPTGSDTDKRIIGRVVSRDACLDNLGWYYDDPNNPTRIIACEETCKMIQSSESGKINILLGCGTLIL